MDRSAHFFVGKCCDDTFDLPPMAESQDIARVAAAFRARGGLQPGVVAEPIEQVRCLFKGMASGDEGRVHGRSLTPNLFLESRRSWSTSRSPCSAGAGAARPPLPWARHGKANTKGGRFPLDGGDPDRRSLGRCGEQSNEGDTDWDGHGNCRRSVDLAPRQPKPGLGLSRSCGRPRSLGRCS